MRVIVTRLLEFRQVRALFSLFHSHEHAPLILRLLGNPPEYQEKTTLAIYGVRFL